MSENQLAIQKADEVDFTQVAEIAKRNVPVMMDSTNKAMAAMETITEITSDEQDAAANLLLSRIKLSYIKVSDLRKGITDPYDAFKKTLMLMEGELSTIKGKDNGYNRIKIMREQYAQIAIDKRRKEEEDLEKEKLISNKLIDYETEIRKNIELGPGNLYTAADLVMSKWYDEITLENFDEKEKMTNYKPKLKIEVYEEWFKVNMDMSGVASEKIEELVGKLKGEFTYDAINKIYQAGGIERLNAWKEKLPGLKKRLEDIAKADDKEKQKLENQLKAKKKIDANALVEKEKEEKELALKKIDDDANDRKIETDFVEQGSKQQLDKPKAATKYVARFKDEKWLKSFAEIIYHVVMLPEFPGLFATDNKGNIKKDDKGREEYIAPVDWWVKKFAAKCNAKVEGITLIADAKVQTRAQKD